MEEQESEEVVGLNYWKAVVDVQMVLSFQSGHRSTRQRIPKLTANS
jgi:hypothetical protein